MHHEYTEIPKSVEENTSDKNGDKEEETTELAANSMKKQNSFSKESNKTCQTVDGVFSNITEKPKATLHSEIEVNEPQKEKLPEYDEDSPCPPYPVHVVCTEGIQFVDGIPAGTMFQFIYSILVTFLFQFIGFIICYIFSISHAGKLGARAGLGLNIMNFAFTVPVEGSESSSWLTYVLIFLGWLVFLQSWIEFMRVRKTEQLINSPGFSV